ncbi:unnamed protein product, partial [Brassica rapa]
MLYSQVMLWLVSCLVIKMVDLCLVSTVIEWLFPNYYMFTFV